MLNKNITWSWFYQLNYIICESLQLRISFSTLYISTEFKAISKPLTQLQASVCCQLLLTESKETQLCKFRNKRCRGNACWIHTLNCALIQNSPLPLLHYFGSATDSTVRWTDSVSLIPDVRALNFQYKIHWPFYLCIYVFIYLFIVMKWSSKYSFSAKEMQTTKVENVGCGMN